MALIFQQKLVLSALLIFSMLKIVSSHNKRYTPPSVTRLTDFFPYVSIANEFSQFFGASNIHLTANGSMATLSLDKSSGRVINLLFISLIVI